MNESSKTKPDDLENPTSFRSPLLLARENSSLLVVDVQEKLIRLIQNHRRLVWNIDRLIRGAKLLDVPVSATEQYPEGLGRTVSPLLEYFDDVPDKTLFSCRQCEELFETLKDEERFNLVIVGVETHVCVLQTALDMQANGFDVFVVVDAVGSRSAQDFEIAIRRLEAAGITITTTESVLFEWCERSDISQFKAVSKLVQEQQPN